MDRDNLSIESSQEEFEAKFRRHSAAARVRFAQVGSHLALILVPMGVVLDYFVFPEIWPVFFSARLLCSLVLLPMALLLRTDWGVARVRPLSMLLMGLPALAIDWMIWFQQGIESPYYVGILLIVVIGCKLPLFSVLEALTFCLLNMVAYLTACALARDGTPLQIAPLVNNLFFLGTISAICITVVYYDYQRRRWEFRLQFELSQRNETLSQLDRLKSQFFANLSHELRTPLNLILVPVELMLQRPQAWDPATASSLVMVLQNAQRLFGMIEDLLDMVRVEEGRLVLQRRPMELVEFVRQVARMFRPLAESKGLRLEFDNRVTAESATAERVTVESVAAQQGVAKPEIWIDGDSERMRRVLYNLLNNAIKFTPAKFAQSTPTARRARALVTSDETRSLSGDSTERRSGTTQVMEDVSEQGADGAVGVIRLSIERRGKWVAVTVSDNGPGIAPRHMPRIFERFYQAQEGQLSFQGLGLGLALVKELVEGHGGTITARSTWGEGTQFDILLPTLDDRNAAEPSTSERQRVGQRGVQGEARRGEEATEQVALRSSPDAWEAIPSAELNPVLASGAATGAPSLWPVANIWPAEGDFPVGPGSSEDRVLVVDDEDDMRQLLSSILGERHRVTYCAAGARAVQLAAELRPQLVVLDVMLPDFDGLEVARRLRATEGLADTKILMLTARMDEGTRIAGLKNGADDFLNKPFGAVELVTRVDNLLRTAKLQRELRMQNQELRLTVRRLNETRAQLVQSEKMNSLGALAAGLLHEINNPLNFMKLAVETLVRPAEVQPAVLRETLADLSEGLDRIDAIITSLRAFAYPDAARLHRMFELQQAIETALRFTSHILVDVAVVYEKVPRVQAWGDMTQISQVFVNLLTNAQKAIELAPTGEPGRIEIRWQKVGKRWEITLSDNGPGIPPKLLACVTDPFITTAEVGQGVGLGLSVAHSIIQGHGGQLRVANGACGAEITFDLAAEEMGRDA